MLDLITLPIVWLVFFLLGLILNNKKKSFQGYALFFISILFIYSYCDYKTTLLLLSVNAIIIFGGYCLFRINNRLIRIVTLVPMLLFSVGMIFLFLKYKFYFSKYFLYLPSLSYLGFRSISYIIYVYKNKKFSLSSSLLQLSFFPIMIMGPITRVDDFERDQYYNYDLVLERLAKGLFMLLIGNMIGSYVIQNISTDISSYELWLSAFANSFNIYLLFAGYTHLIIGLGLLVGIKLPENFNNPYISTSVSEFWRRWHMSLSFWIRDFLYIPLGGNRYGLVRKILHIMFAMIVCGLWHGISYNFFIWGLYHGFFISIESVMDNFGFSPLRKFVPNRFYVPLKIIITFLITMISWIFFSYKIDDAILFLKIMFSLNE